MNSYINPIKTVFNSVEYTSQLESKWAEFFFRLGIKYDYQPKSFDLGPCIYTPDFWLTDFETWIEVKPLIEGQDQLLCLLLAIYTNQKVLWIEGNPMIGKSKIDLFESKYTNFIEYCEKEREHYFEPNLANCQFFLDKKVDRVLWIANSNGGERCLSDHKYSVPDKDKDRITRIIQKPKRESLAQKYQLVAESYADGYKTEAS